MGAATGARTRAGDDTHARARTPAAQAGLLRRLLGGVPQLQPALGADLRVLRGVIASWPTRIVVRPAVPPGTASVPLSRRFREVLNGPSELRENRERSNAPLVRRVGADMTPRLV